MPETMSISVNGESRVPPGFRFHPTEEELLLYYLKKKVACQKIDLDVICEVDLNKLEPWDIQEKCKIGSTPQNDWYFFSHKDKKYPTGTRTNRATTAGFWKATGRDKMIYMSSSARKRLIGMRKTLVFYKGRAPHGHKSDWIMHEYRLDVQINLDQDQTNNHVSHGMGSDEAAQEEGWVVCRIFKKKNYHKALDSSPITSTLTQETTTNMTCSSSSTMLREYDNDQGSLEQIFKRPQEDDPRAIRPVDPYFLNSPGPVLEKSMKLPGLLDSPSSSANHGGQPGYQPFINPDALGDSNSVSVYDSGDHMAGFGDWGSLDRLVACHLNGQKQQQLGECFDDDDDENAAGFYSVQYSDDGDHHHDHHHLPELMRSSTADLKRPNNNNNNIALDRGDEMELWSFARSSLMMDTLCHPSMDARSR
ncbi:hypothetical protein Dimus_006699 [Dionaea muscipula]